MLCIEFNRSKKFKDLSSFIARITISKYYHHHQQQQQHHHHHHHHNLNHPGGKGRPARKADNLTTICEPIV
jgi:hypothetical protein